MSKSYTTAARVSSSWKKRKLIKCGSYKLVDDYASTLDYKNNVVADVVPVLDGRAMGRDGGRTGAACREGSDCDLAAGRGRVV